MPHVFVDGSYTPLTTEVTVPADIVAFARTSGNDAVIVAAPRLSTPLTTPDAPVPLGSECWKTSRILLPETLRGRRYLNILTGEEIQPTVASDEGWLFAGQAFQTLPVAILTAI